MVETMVHRGPDDRGVALDDRIGMAMQRLSIIGVANGHQPIQSETGLETVVVNGEIYNYPRLKKDLIARGHEFRTDSDAEVTVHLYQEVGEDFVRSLRGMFALALWDRARQELLLARDRTGQKPLYYSWQNQQLVFASEIKAIHASGLVAKELNEEAILSYWTFGFVPGEDTLFRSIKRVPPGHLLRVHRGEISLQRFWDFPESKGADISFDVAAEEVRNLVEEAIDVRLVSEVPIGAFLSGGMDSSVVVGRMAEKVASPVQTFAVGFADSQDELPHARAVARHFGTLHHEILVENCPGDLLTEINWYADEPASDPAAVPTFLLSRYASSHITVALTGEGGDEVFAGYSHYWNYLRLSRLEKQMPGFPLIASLLGTLEPLVQRVGPRRIQKALWLASLPGQDRVRGLITPFTDRDLSRLTIEGVDGSRLGGIVEQTLGTRRDSTDPLSQLLYFDAKTTLADQLLMKVDKMSMAASLEARSPLLDHELLEYVAGLPAEFKLSHHGSKLVLRRAFQGQLPREILARKKQGFDVPLQRWLVGDLRERVETLLLAKSTPLDSVARTDRIRELWRDFEATRDGRLARQIWRILNLAIWLDLHWGNGATGVKTSAAARRNRLARHSEGVQSEIHDFSS